MQTKTLRNTLTNKKNTINQQQITTDIVAAVFGTFCSLNPRERTVADLAFVLVFSLVLALGSGVATGCARRVVHEGPLLCGGPDEPCVRKIDGRRNGSYILLRRNLRRCTVLRSRGLRWFAGPFGILAHGPVPTLLRHWPSESILLKTIIK